MGGGTEVVARIYARLDGAEWLGRLAVRLSVGLMLHGVAPVGAQPPASHPRVKEAIAAYEKWLDGERAFLRIPGVASALVIDQDVVWQGGSGFADLARKTPATPGTLYSSPLPFARPISASCSLDFSSRSWYSGSASAASRSRTPSPW